jgi:hypothetical protein
MAAAGKPRQQPHNEEFRSVSTTRRQRGALPLTVPLPRRCHREASRPPAKKLERAIGNTGDAGRERD